MPVLPWSFECKHCFKLSRLHFCQHQKFRDILAAGSACISISCTSPYTVWWRRLTPSRVFHGFPVSRSYLRASQAWITMGYDGPISSLRYGHNPLFYCWGSLWDFLGAKPVSLEEYAKAHKLPKWQRFWNTGKARLSEWQKQVHHYPFGYASRCVPDTGLRSAALIWELHRHWKLCSCWGLRDAVNCKCYLWLFVLYLCSFGFNLVQT